MSGKLYVVGTPIGNLSDMSPRGIKTLSEVDFIAAEDTRVSIKLLNRFEIKKPMVSYHEHNLRERGQLIINRILTGENCAIITDAGMPCISDPGEDLILLCAENSIETIVIPGPSAVISALCVSGLPTSRFSFEGFLSAGKKNRSIHLNEVKNNQSTLIFYEAPHKLVRTLKDMLYVFGDRKISIVKEITKIHEQINRTTLSQAVQFYDQITPKGEYVLIIEGASKPENQDQVPIDEAIKMAADLTSNGIKPSEAAKQISKETGHKRSDIYKGLV